MKSLFRLFAVTCDYCNPAIDALTPVNNARLFDPGPYGPRDPRISVPKVK
jgi:hypothetical protein